MDYFHYCNGELFAEQVPVTTIGQQIGTPCYIYSRKTLERHWHAFDKAFDNTPHLICYAVKANSNLAVLDCLARLGSGFDIVSVGELERVLAAGGDPQKIVFSGVAKRADEIQRALEVGIYCFNVESAAELDLIASIAKHLGKRAPVSLRINPDIDAKTHPYISTGLKENKFGVDFVQARALYQQAKKSTYLDPIGLDCHIGSQLTSLQPFLDALDRLLLLYQHLLDDGIQLSHFDLGGGLGVCYRDETPPHPSEYTAQLVQKIKNLDLKIILEPGRAIAANSGILLTQIVYQKQGADRRFLLVDAGMNDLLRPALYQAWHTIIPVIQRPELQEQRYDIAGPVCESADVFGKQRRLQVQDKDLLALRTAGAYGFCMSSDYNSRPRPAEVMVDGDRFYIVRQRDAIADLFAKESRLAVQ